MWCSGYLWNMLPCLRSLCKVSISASLMAKFYKNNRMSSSIDQLTYILSLMIAFVSEPKHRPSGRSSIRYQASFLIF